MSRRWGGLRGIVQGLWSPFLFFQDYPLVKFTYRIIVNAIARPPRLVECAEIPCRPHQGVGIQHWKSWNFLPPTTGCAGVPGLEVGLGALHEESATHCTGCEECISSGGIGNFLGAWGEGHECFCFYSYKKARGTYSNMHVHLHIYIKIYVYRAYGTCVEGHTMWSSPFLPERISNRDFLPNKHPKP